MDDQTTVGLAAIIVLGVGAQWVARELRLPSIVLLLIAGVLAGPVAGIVEPDELFGESLFPGVSLAVSLLLFESALGLRFEDLRGGVRQPVVRLTTIGVLVTLGLTAVAAKAIFSLPWDFAFLLGAVLVVSGPTVVGPILDMVRPREPVGSVLSWEGTFVDPIGATAGIVVLNVAVLSDDSPFRQGPDTLAVGIGVGVVVAVLLVASLRWYLVPDDLEVPVAVLFAVFAFGSAQYLQDEAGLMATTVLGVAVANQPWVPVGRISFFHRSLGTLIIGSLFIVLAARIDLSDLVDVIPRTAVLVGLLVLVVRPIVAFLSTARTRLDRRERAFVGWMAPRGIVAAATSALFALQIEANGERFSQLVPVTFGVIIGTAVVYGLSAVPVAHRLRVTKGKPRGVALVGARPWLLELARVLAGQGAEVVVIATGAYDLAERDDLPYRVDAGSFDDEDLRMQLDDVACALVASEDMEHNRLAVQECVERVGRSGVYLLPERADAPARARVPFGAGATRPAVDHAFTSGSRFVVVAEDDADAGTASAESETDGQLDVATIAADGSVSFVSRRRAPRPGERRLVLDGWRSPAPTDR